MPVSSQTRKDQRKKLLRAAFLNPKNLIVLVIGITLGIIDTTVIPIGIMAYGLLCYLNLNSDEFVKQVLYPNTGSPAEATGLIHSFSEQEFAQTLEAEELRHLRTNIMASQEKIQQLYTQAEPFLQHMFGDMFQVENLVERSGAFLLKAQTIQNYLDSEDLEKIYDDIAALEGKIQQVSDEFSKQQYRQALEARQKHLESLEDIHKIDERLISQLTNISLSLDSIYSRMMKLKSSDYSMKSAESDQVSEQLNRLVADVEQLDAALNENLGFEE
jgi:Ni,Fe-hydrogenase I large subunit